VTSAWRDECINWVREVRRSVNDLKSRGDIDGIAINGKAG